MGAIKRCKLVGAIRGMLRTKKNGGEGGASKYRTEGELVLGLDSRLISVISQILKMNRQKLEKSRNRWLSC